MPTAAKFKRAALPERAPNLSSFSRSKPSTSTLQNRQSTLTIVKPPISAALFDFDGVLRHFDMSGLHAIEGRHRLENGFLLRALLRPDRLNAALTGQTSDEAWR